MGDFVICMPDSAFLKLKQSHVDICEYFIHAKSLDPPPLQ